MTIEESLSIENVVASTDIGQELALETLAMDLGEKGADYDPDQFPGVVYRTENPQAAALIFRSGKLVCTGAHSVPGVRESITLVFEELEALNIDVPADPDIIIQNIVSSGDLGTNLNLNAIAIGLGIEAVEYEPEQFPGLVYRFDEPDVVTLLFGSGKLVITGGKEPDDANQAIRRVQAELEELGLLA